MSPLLFLVINLKQKKRKVGRPRRFIAEHWLRGLYAMKGATVRSVANRCGVSPGTLQKLMREYKIKPKRMSWVRSDK